MVSTCFYFQVHQPYRIRKYSFFEIGNNNNYFGDNSDSKLNNKKMIKKVSEKCYLPANKTILSLIKKHPEFKVAYSFSGVVLEQFKEYYPEVLNSFQELVDTGNVEILGETSHHTLAFLFDKQEFRNQVLKHKFLIKNLFKQTPKIFRNTELVFNNEIAKEAEDLGYKGILAEGTESILGWRSPNFVYRPKNAKKIKLLLKNYKLSDDIAFRFSERSWEEWPLTAEKFAYWISAHNGNAHTINLFMDYETFGEHQWESTGIFEFLKKLPSEILKHPDNDFKTPYEVIKSYPVMDELDFPYIVSWADVERDLSAWLGNPLQNFAIKSLYSLKEPVLKSRNQKLINTWRKLQTSDHFYYMCTKWFADGDVHKYFNPYDSPYDAFISFMNILADFKIRLGLKEKNLKVPQSFILHNSLASERR